VLTSQVNSPTNDFEGRNLGGGIGRYPTVSPKIGTTNLFGFGDFSGDWEFDSSGQVIGSYTQVVENRGGAGTTNKTSGVTNSVSFRAKVVPGKRLTMTCSAASGKILYKGVALNPLPEINGHWYGSRQQNDRTFVEFFDLLSSEAVFPNLYELVGAGPSYPMTGVCMRSAQGKIAFGIEQGSTNAVLRTSIGSFGSSSKAYKSKTKGIAAPHDAITFDTVLTPSK
jgi:hypothetical protein